VQSSPTTLDRSAKWRGEGITEVLVVIVVVNCAIDFFAPVFAVILMIMTEGSLRFTTAFLLVVMTSSVAAAALAACVAHRARWHWGGIISRSAATGACGLVFGLGWLALLLEYFGS
jgi:hypothetical protein